MGEKILKTKNASMNSDKIIESSSTMTGNRDITQATKDMHRELTLNKMKQTLESFESSIISDVQQKMDGMIEEIIQQIKHYELNANEFKDFAQQQHQLLWSNRIQKDNNNDEDTLLINKAKISIEKNKRKKLPDKVFKSRNSYLTCLLEVTHMKSIYHIFFVILTVLFLHTFIHDYVVDGKINIGVDTIKAGFGKIHIALIIWSLMQITVFALYYAFKLWAVVKHLLRKQKILQRLWNYVCVLGYGCYQYYFIYLVSISVIEFDLAIVTSFSLLMEMARFVMKTHAFIRTNAAVQFVGKQKVDNDETNEKESTDAAVPKITKFSTYLYFLFAPTLIYREVYPRTKVIRWSFVIVRLLEVVATMFFQSYFFERYLRSSFQNFGKEQITPGNLIVALFNMMMPGLMIFLSCFYCLLHAWLNATSEMLRFADRMFYKDWWTCKNFESYYRKWNVVVHDWLYEYIYKDCYIHIFKGSKSASALATFFISAIVHEYILAITLRFVFPILFVSFAGCSVILTFVMKNYEHDFGNFVLWFSLAAGNGMVVSLYTMESYARQNCPIDDSHWTDYIIPRILTCNGITNNV